MTSWRKPIVQTIHRPINEYYHVNGESGLRLNLILDSKWGGGGTAKICENGVGLASGNKMVIKVLCKIQTTILEPKQEQWLDIYQVPLIT